MIDNLSCRAKEILKGENYFWHPDMWKGFKVDDYQRVVKLWLLFKRDCRDFEYAEELIITTKKLNKALEKELPWFRIFQKNSSQFIKGEISRTAKWKFIATHIINELESYYEELLIPEIEQLSLEV